MANHFFVKLIVLLSGLCLLNSFAAEARFKKIVDTHSKIPGGQGNFSYFSAPYFYKDKLVVRGYGNNSQKGVYTNLYGPFSVVANTKTAIPEGQGRFISFGELRNREKSQSQHVVLNSPS